MGLFGGVDCEGDGPEPVVVCALWMVEEQLPGLRELVSFQVQLVMAADSNDKMREKGVERLTVQAVCKAARDEGQVREPLDALWSDPERAGEIMRELRNLNDDLNRLEEILENGGV